MKVRRRMKIGSERETKRKERKVGERGRMKVMRSKMKEGVGQDDDRK